MTACRWCAGPDPAVVLDLGPQPAADSYPAPGEPVARTPLRMAVCGACGLAQLVEDPGVREEPLGVEPAALREQATDAVSRLTAAGVVAAGRTFVEFDSPHGGGWRELLVAAGMLDRTDDSAPGTADLVVDVFGLMHDADQRAALVRRVELLAPGGTVALQYQPLERIVELGQWNALRHGHMAYYAHDVLAAMVGELGLTPGERLDFSLYGGTSLATATRSGQREPVPAITPRPDDRPDARPLAELATRSAADLHRWLTMQRSAGVRVLGYGAASRTTPLLNAAGVTSELLPGVVDAAPGKQGRVVPGVGVPILAPDLLRTDPPDVVLLFLTDLLGEVRAAFPAVEASGGRWAVADPTVREVTELAV